MISSLLVGAALAQTPSAAAPDTSAEARKASDEADLEAGILLVPPPKGVKSQFIIGGLAGYQFRTDFDDGGSLATTRFGLGTQFRMVFSDALSLGLNLGYRFDRYEFNGNVFPSLGEGVDPWRDIQTIGLGAVLSWRLDDRWTLSGGPIGQFSGEADAEAGDAASGGGLISATYKFSDSLLLGGGVAVVSRIEDDPLVFPVLIAEWRISDTLRFTTRGGPTAVLREGMELIWTPVKPIELALGARYEYLRFRLAEGNTFSDGIGEEQSVQVWLRASWEATPHIRLDLFGGLAPWSEIQLSDSGGGVLAESDLDPAPFIAGAVSIRF